MLNGGSHGLAITGTTGVGGWAKRAKLISIQADTVDRIWGGRVVRAAYRRRGQHGHQQLGAPQTVFDLVLPFAARAQPRPVAPPSEPFAFQICLQSASQLARVAACVAQKEQRLVALRVGHFAGISRPPVIAVITKPITTMLGKPYLLRPDSSGTLQKRGCPEIRFSSFLANYGALCTVAAQIFCVAPGCNRLDTSVANQVQRAAMATLAATNIARGGAMPGIASPTQPAPLSLKTKELRQHCGIVLSGTETWTVHVVSEVASKTLSHINTL